MNKKGLFFLVFLFSVCLSFKASAQLKLDGLAGAERVLTSVQTAIESVQKKINEASKIFLGNLWGDKDATNWETFKALRTKIKDTVAAGKELYDEGKDLIADSEDALKDSYEQLRGEIKGIVPVSSAALEYEIGTIEKEMDDRRTILGNELASKLKSAQENEQILNTLYAAAEDDDTKESLSVQIANAEAIRQQLEADYNSLSSDENAYLASDETFQDLKAKRDEKAAELSNTLASLAEKGKGLAATFVQGMIKKSPAQRAADYLEAESKSFASEDEELTQEVVDRINKERLARLEKDMANAFMQIVRVRKKAGEFEEEKSQIVGNIEAADKAITSQRLQNKLKIMETEMLNDRVELEISELRLKSSLDMIKQPYRVPSKDRDHTRMNMDDYVVTKESIEAQTQQTREDGD
ncbi:MAG: hypothetical protein IKS23_05295 [Alphaproteobacteria bacterium]|nr:hypothetical protein [Alphaproteobacteria bacterium]